MNIHYANLNDNSNQWIDTGHNDTDARNFSYKDGKYFYISGNSDMDKNAKFSHQTTYFSGQKSYIYK